MRSKLRKFLPDHDAIRNNRWLSPFANTLLHPRLWHLNRRSAAGAVAAGMFCGLIPGPLQMLGAAICAVIFRVNLPLAMATTLYTNPFTIVPLYLLAIAYGKFLLGASHQSVVVEPYAWDWAHWLDSLQGLAHWTLSLGKPLAVGLPALALTLAAAGYCAVQIAWRAYVVLAWRRRARQRAERKASH